MAALALLLFAAMQSAPVAPAPASADVGPVAANPAGVLVVASPDVTDAQLAAIYAGLSAARVPTVDAAQRRGVHKEVVVASQSSLDTLKAANLDARSKWRVLDLDGATNSLRRAEIAFFDLVTPREGLSTYADTLLLRAEIALTKQDAAKAAKELRLLARIDPARKALHPGLYAPALVDAYSAARSANTESTPGFLTLTPRTERGAAVSATLDQNPIPGVAAGVTSSIRPPIGPHLLIVRAPGRKAFVARVDVQAQTPLTLAPFLASPFAERERSDLAKLIRGHDDTALLPLAQRTGATAIVLVGLESPTSASSTAASSATLWTTGMGSAERVALSGSKNDPVGLGIAVRAALDVREQQEVEAVDDGYLGLVLWSSAGLTAAVALTGMGVGLAIYTYRRGFPGQVIDPIDPIVLPKSGTCCSVPVR